MTDASVSKAAPGSAARSGGANRRLRATAPSTASRPDLATLLGLVAAFGLVALAITTGGTATAFIDPASALIVIGGTFGVTTMCYSLGEVMSAPRAVIRALTHRRRAPGLAANFALQIAEAARAQGPLALESYLPKLRHEPFFHKALAHVIDGVPAEELTRVMERERQATSQRHAGSAGILRKSAEVAPAMGLIGTLVGLVQMLGRLEDPSSIGPAMAVALLTTFYGAVLSTMVFAPLASKLERNAREETLVNEIFVLTANSIARQENPRKLETLLNTVLPPGERLSRFA